jgi:peptide/nickel transport system permease protein
MAESRAILSGPALPADLGEIADAAPLHLFLRRFRRHRLALGAVVVLVLLVASAVLAPVVSGYDPTDIDLALMRQPPSGQHWLGTDLNGRDVLSRLLHAGRISLSVGIVAVSISTAIGMALGGVAGYVAGRVDTLVMRVTDVFMAFPTLIIVITLVSFVGPSIYNVMLALGVFGWPGTCRLVRAQVLVLRGQEFTQAARALGASHWRVVARHMLPNAVSPVVVSATFGVANAILTEAGLSFLGLGVQAPTPSWGNMLQSARGLTELESMPWLWVPPGLMVMLAVLAINFIGDGLRDALDPRTSGLR